MNTDTCGRCGVEKRVNTEHDPFRCDGFTRKQLRVVKKRIAELHKRLDSTSPIGTDEVLAELEMILRVITIPDADEVAKPMMVNDRFGFEEVEGINDNRNADLHAEWPDMVRRAQMAKSDGSGENE